MRGFQWQVRQGQEFEIHSPHTQVSFAVANSGSEGKSTLTFCPSSSPASFLDHCEEGRCILKRTELIHEEESKNCCWKSLVGILRCSFLQYYYFFKLTKPVKRCLLSASVPKLLIPWGGGGGGENSMLEIQVPQLYKFSKGRCVMQVTVGTYYFSYFKYTYIW